MFVLIIVHTRWSLNIPSIFIFFNNNNKKAENSNDRRKKHKRRSLDEAT